MTPSRSYSWCVAAFVAIAAVACAEESRLIDGFDVPEVDIDVLRSQLERDFVVTMSFDTLPSGNVTALRPVVHAENTGERDIEVLVSGCPWQLTMYDNPDRSGDPIWNAPTVCGEPLLPFVIRSGEAVEWSGPAVGMETIIADYGSGDYFFAVELVIDVPELRTGEIPGGSVRFEP